MQGLGARRFFSKEVKDWLSTKGISDHLSDDIIKAFPGGKVKLSEIQALGQSGLTSLVDSIKREHAHQKSPPSKISIKVREPGGVVVDFSVPVNTSFYQLAKTNPDLAQYMECACSGVAACSTCHVIVDKEWFDKLPPAEEDELDMLDLAWGVTDTSRLGCQIRFTKKLDGLCVTLPEKTNNLF